jgi:signal transduction histidine kinase
MATLDHHPASSEPACARKDGLSLQLRAGRSSPIPTVVTEGERHEVRHVNPAICRMLGLHADQLEGRPWTDLASSTDGHDPVAHFDVVYETGIAAAERVLVTGDAREVLAMVQPWFDDDDRPRGLIIQLVHDSILMPDRPAESQLADDLRAANERLVLSALQHQELAEREKLATDEIRTLEHVREQYVSLISHDLRGPLSAAKMAAQLLLRPSTGESREPHDLAERVIRNLNRMDRMLQDLLDAQRLRAGEPLQLKLETCDLTRLTHSVVEDLRVLHGDVFRVQGEAQLCGVWSPDALTRALWNLAVNAVNYGFKNTPVVIRLTRRDERVTVSVNNRGPPIRPEEMVKLFQPFTRTTNATSGKEKGWGLGLTLVQGCAEAHGGSVTVTSEVETGTTFTLDLPVDARQSHAAPGPVCADAAADETPLSANTQVS